MAVEGQGAEEKSLDIRFQTSDFRHQTSDIRHQISDLRSQISDLRFQRSSTDEGQYAHLTSVGASALFLCRAKKRCSS